MKSNRNWLNRLEMAALLGISERTLYRQVDAGLVPNPPRLGGNRIGWFRKAAEKAVEERRRSGGEWK